MADSDSNPRQGAWKGKGSRRQGAGLSGLQVRRKQAAGQPRREDRWQEAAGRGRLDIDVVSSTGLTSAGLAAWLRRIAPPRARGAVTVAIVSDARVRTLNRVYRKTDRPTDVLSFAADERGYLGDVVIAAGMARRQAREAGHAVGTELRILALHGLLHLLGYDHETDAGRMSRVERRLRAKGGLPVGLIERSSG